MRTPMTNRCPTPLFLLTDRQSNGHHFPDPEPRAYPIAIPEPEDALRLAMINQHLPCLVSVNLQKG